MAAVPISAYLGLFFVIFLGSFILYTVAAFFAFGISRAIRKRALNAGGFIGENFKRVALFSFMNAFSSTAIIIWRLWNFVPPDIGGALVGPLVIIVFTVGLTTPLWAIVLVAYFVKSAAKKDVAIVR